MIGELSAGEEAVHGKAIALTLPAHEVNLLGMAQDGSLVLQLTVAIPPVAKAQRSLLAPDEKALAEVVSTKGPPLVRVFIARDKLHQEVIDALEQPKAPTIEL